MISEVVTFKLRPGMTRAEVVAMYRKTSSIWRNNPDCIRKCYLYDGEKHLGEAPISGRTWRLPRRRTAMSGAA